MTHDKLIFICYLCAKNRVSPFSWDYRMMVRRNCSICNSFKELVPGEEIVICGFVMYVQVRQRMVGFYASRDTALCK